MAKATTPAERTQRYREHIAKTWSALNFDSEQAELADIIQEATLAAIEAGQPLEAQTWAALGNLRAALRAKAWR